MGEIAKSRSQTSIPSFAWEEPGNKAKKLQIGTASVLASEHNVWLPGGRVSIEKAPLHQELV